MDDKVEQNQQLPIVVRSTSTVEEVLKIQEATILTPSHSNLELNAGRRCRPTYPAKEYNLHKAIASSAMDISLLTANANQLRLLLAYNNRSKTYIACITLVIVSLVLQILVACGVIIIKSQPKPRRNVWVRKMKIKTSIGVTIVTVINILVASLVVTDVSG